MIIGILVAGLIGLCNPIIIFVNQLFADLMGIALEGYMVIMNMTVTMI
jgi:hypothetical protein